MRTVIVKKIQPGSQFPDPRLTWAQVHEIFLKECTGLGIRPPSYPFCSDSLGSHALKAWGKREQARKEKNNSGHKENEVGPGPATRVYERVEIDGHFLDVNWTLEIPSLNGDQKTFASASVNILGIAVASSLHCDINGNSTLTQVSGING